MNEPIRGRSGGAWVPIVVLLLGLGSTVILVATWQVRVRQLLTNLAQVQAVEEIQTNIATSHLWLEEFVTADEVEKGLIVENLDAASSLVATLLGEESAHGNELPKLGLGPLTDPVPIGQAKQVRQEIDRFRGISIDRMLGFEAGREVGIGSAMDVRYDAVFFDLFERASELEVELRELRVRKLAHSNNTFAVVVIAWLFMIAVALFGLNSYERRRAQAEAALRESQRRLLQAQKMQAVGSLAGGLAHDINNYLAAITSQSELVKLKAEPGGAVARRMETITATAFKASRLLQRLLTFAKRQPNRTRVVDLNQAILEIEPMLLRLVGEDVALHLDLEENPWRVEVDPVEFEQSIVNLLINARDAMPGGGRLTVETRNLATANGDEVLLEVRDTGVGIAPEVRERIFEPFFTTKRASKGNGLGLATVYGMVQQLEGRIEVESAPGEGATFLLTLPRSKGVPAEVREVSPRAGIRELGGSETILYVEDNDELRLSIVALLEGLGYTVPCAPDGAQALCSVEELGDRIDLLISDVVMPGMSGQELVQEVRRERPELKVIFVSGYTDNVINAHGVKRGEFDFLAKPFSAAELARVVREVLDRPAPNRVTPGANG